MSRSYFARLLACSPALLVHSRRPFARSPARSRSRQSPLRHEHKYISSHTTPTILIHSSTATFLLLAYRKHSHLIQHIFSSICISSHIFFSPHHLPPPATVRVYSISFPSPLNPPLFAHRASSLTPDSVYDDTLLAKYDNEPTTKPGSPVFFTLHRFLARFNSSSID